MKPRADACQPGSSPRARLNELSIVTITYPPGFVIRTISAKASSGCLTQVSRPMATTTSHVAEASSSRWASEVIGTTRSATPALEAF